MIEKAGLGRWFNWNWEWFSRTLPDYRIEMLTTEHDYILARIHELSFPKGWNTTDFERMLADRTIIADGLFIGQNTEPQGFVISRQVEDESEIITIALAPSIRQKGLSFVLLASHLDVLRYRGVRQVFLEVEESNSAALALYRHLGFQQIGMRKGYYHQQNGQVSSALMMKAEL